MWGVPEERDECIQAYKEASRLAPDWLPPRRWLAHTLDESGRADEALSEYRDILRRDPSHWGVYWQYSRIHLRDDIPPPTDDDALRREIQRLEDAWQHRWGEPEIQVLRDEYRRSYGPRLATFASVDSVVDGPSVLVSTAGMWRLYRGYDEPSTDLEWTTQRFDDSGWEPARAGFGYPAARRVGTLLPEMRNGFSTVYARATFSLLGTENFDRLTLDVQMDDGVVAYLNGKEIGRTLAGEFGSSVGHETTATGERPFYQVREFRVPADALVPGTNVLALQGLNASIDDFDFYLCAELTASPTLRAGRRERAVTAYEAHRAAASSPHDALVLRYFEARLAELDGDYERARVIFEEVVDAEPARPEPLLGLADALVRLDARPRAEDVLVEALEGRLGTSKALWDRWIDISLARPNLLPDDYRDLLETISTIIRSDFDELAIRAHEIRWLLEELSAGRTLRINCGGLSNYHDGEVLWSQDRFFEGGLVRYENDLPDGLEALDRQPMYQNERYYYERRWYLTGYSIPLPPGRYRVELHCIETQRQIGGERRFDVIVEGRVERPDYKPLDAGFAVADMISEEVRVDDGRLEIDFARGTGNPKLSAIAIERSGD